MLGALSVRMADGAGHDRHVTAHVRDLRFGKSAYGGHTDASLTVNVPTGMFTDLSANDRIWVYDRRTGETVWEGYLDNPGLTHSPAGESYAVVALGGAALASDAAYPLVYIDRDLDRWQEAHTSDSDASVQVRSLPGHDDTDALRFQWSKGSTVSDADYSAANNRVISGQGGIDLGGFAYKVDFGFNNADVAGSYHLTSWVRLLNGNWTKVRSNPATVTGTQVAPSSTGGEFPTITDGTVQLRFELTATADQDINNGKFWAAVYDPWIRMKLYRPDGSWIVGSGSVYNDDFVRSSAVVRDMLGRGMLPLVDERRAIVENTDTQIDQLTFLPAASAAQVLEQLALFDDMRWWIGSGTGDGHAFGYQAWDDSNPRYVISTADGFTQPGEENTLCNRVVVSWTDARGRDRSKTIRADVPALRDRVRDAEPIDLPGGLGSERNADRVGSRALDLTNRAPKAATAVVRRPIFDHMRGRKVWPWEVEPGGMVLVRETGDRLRCTATDYSDNDCATTLTLGHPIRTLAMYEARLSSTRRRR